MSIFSKIFGDANEKYLKKLRPLVDKINNLEKKFEIFSDEELKKKTNEFKERLKGERDSAVFDDILPEAFAMVREAAKRTLNQRHFDVQIIGGIVLHQGKIAEMKTGEGKTLAATLPLYLNALESKGAHLVTVNDYLAKRDTVWMGQIYHLLGLSVGCIVHGVAYLYDPEYQSETQNSKFKSQNHNLKSKTNKRDEERDLVGGFKVIESYLRPCARKEAYKADITYGTNNQFGFDYLIDNLAYDLKSKVQRGFHYAIVDEIDSILIDEARTPLIISAPDTESTTMYKEFAMIVPRLEENIDYNVDEKMRAVSLTDQGITKVEKILGIKNIYEERGIREVHHLEEALKAEILFKRDKHYVVKDGEIIIVDEFTGRLMPGRRYSGGLHQAIEAKEGVRVQQESRTAASVTFQNYFRMYKKLAGMTGTAVTSAEEFDKVYGLEVSVISTNLPMIRKSFPDCIYKTEQGKLKALITEIKEKHKKGQPVLVGTISIEKNEYLGKLLEKEGIAHQILNAKHHEEEGKIIAQAGRLGQVTIATNMAGRGVDIVLGGNPFNTEEAKKVKDLGGLHVIGTERHEARRIDNQLRGRSGRQGDPGSSQFFVSLEDDLMRVFGGDKIKSLMGILKIPEDQPIEAKIISGAIESAQSKIEGFHFDARKHLLDYDDVMNKQREIFYKKRQEILRLADNLHLKDKILAMVEKEIKRIVDFHCQGNYSEQWNVQEVFEQAKTIFSAGDEIQDELKKIIESKKSAEILRQEIFNYLLVLAKNTYENKEKEIGQESAREIERAVCLKVLDSFWMVHLEEMGHLRDSVQLRAHARLDPLVEYKNEGHKMFKGFLETIESRIIHLIFKIKPIRQPLSFSHPTAVPVSPLKSFSFSAGAGSIKSTNLQSSSLNKNRVVHSMSKKIGRNDPCPCGAINSQTGKPIKYKKCHGRESGPVV